jgi:hypothetical protein
LPYVVAGVGVVLVIYSFVVQLSGEVVLSETIPPQRVDDRTVYTAETVQLEPGLYDLSLRVRRVSTVLELGGLSWRAEAVEHPTWSANGRISFDKDRKEKRRRTRRPDAHGSKPIEVDAAGAYTLRVSFGADLDESLRLRLRTLSEDYRIPLLVGGALVVIGLLMSPELRARLGALTRRG